MAGEFFSMVSSASAIRGCISFWYKASSDFKTVDAEVTSSLFLKPNMDISRLPVRYPLVKPLIEAGVLDVKTAISCFSLTCYSGGGKKMIADYEDPNKSHLLKAPRQYGLTQQHKHLKEMQALTGVNISPAFCPIVADFYSGMEVTVPLFASDIKANINDIKTLYKNYYQSSLVHFDDNADEGGFLSAAALSGKDDMQLCVFGNGDRIILTARYDNLGKGASGAAIQNMNILMGVDETIGLVY